MGCSRMSTRAFHRPAMRPSRGLLWLLLAFLAPPSMRGSAGQPFGAVSAAEVARADAGELLQRWREMSPEQRQSVRENYRRWQDLSEAERDVMRERHQRWTSLQAEVGQDLGAALPAGDRERRDQVRQRTAELLRLRLQQIPTALRREARIELEGLALNERRKLLRDFANEEIVKRINQHLMFLARRGLMPREEAEGLRLAFANRPPVERFEELRLWMIEDPEQFQLPEHVHQHLLRARNPSTALRAIERFNEGLSQARIRLEAFLRENHVSEGEIRELAPSSPPEFRLRLKALLQSHELELPEALKQQIRGTPRDAVPAPAGSSEDS